MKDFAKQALEQTSGCRIVTRQMSLSRSMTKEQVARVEQTFEAAPKSCTGSRRIIGKHEAVNAVYGTIREAQVYVKSHTLDYPEPKIRLIRLDRIESMKNNIDGFKARLAIELDELAERWPEIIEDARERLGNLFVAADYPADPRGHFSLDLDFPAIAPDNRLRTLYPELYEQERERIRARMNDAVIAAEQAAKEELQEMLGHFVERLGDDEEGKPKVLKASALEKIRDFTQRFDEITLSTNEDLAAVVQEIADFSNTLDTNKLRKDVTVRKTTAEQTHELLDKINQLVMDRPARVLELE